MASVRAQLRSVVDAVEGAGALDEPARAIGKQVRGTFSAGALKDAVSGSWLGHALHPPLTDVVIGSFLSATMLDLIGADEQAVERLLAIGIASYGPTAVTGINDWADAEPVDDAVRRVGIVHATVNLSALTLYVAALAGHRAGARGRGRLLTLAGAALLSAGGYLGGHLSYTRGVGPNQTAFDQGPDDWTDAAASDAVRTGEPTQVVVADTPVLLVRTSGGLRAIHDRCSHRGCSLAGGELDGESITCSCHGSRFDLRDGSVERGPATAGQPSFSTRESDGQIQVRLATRG